MGMAGFAFKTLLDTAVASRVRKVLATRQEDRDIFDSKGEIAQRRKALMKNIFLFFILILVGTIFFAVVNEEREGDKWVSSFYLAVTFITLGFGSDDADTDA